MALEQVDSAIRNNRIGAVYRAIGWTLLGFDIILTAFIFVGLRTGSNFWLDWVIIEGALGLTLIGIGARKQARAAAEVAGSLQRRDQQYRKAS
jgi:threonine/homoserine/homoserine lactone efflux protein